MPCKRHRILTPGSLQGKSDVRMQRIAALAASRDRLVRVMPQPARIFQLVTEVLFALLGLLLVWLAASGRAQLNPRSLLWLAVAVLLAYRGLRAWLQAGRYALRWQHRLRGGSLLLVGVMLLALSAIPEALGAPVLTAAGLVLITRGILGVALVVRQG